MYKNRKAERTDDNVVFNWAKTVCAVIFTIVFAIEGMLVLLGLFMDRTEGIAHYAGIRMCIVLLILILSVAGYLIACMIIEKKLRVFKKRYLVKALIMSGILTLFTVLYIHDAFGIETKVPQTQDLDAAWVSGAQIITKSVNDYYSEGKRSTDEELKAITGLHRIIVDNMDELEDIYDSINDSYYIRNYEYNSYGDFELNVVKVNYNRLYIHYILSDGNDYYKNYCIMPEGPLFEKIKAYVNQYPEIFLERSGNEINFYFD